MSASHEELFKAQVNFSGPKIFFTEFWLILVTFKIKNVATSIWFKEWGRVAPGRFRAGDAR